MNPVAQVLMDRATAVVAGQGQQMPISWLAVICDRWMKDRPADVTFDAFVSAQLDEALRAAAATRDRVRESRRDEDRDDEDDGWVLGHPDPVGNRAANELDKAHTAALLRRRAAIRGGAR